MPRRRSETAHTRGTRWALLGILLLGAALRFAALPAVPPGIEHDEVAEMQIAEGILDGRHAFFFREAFGQEPLFLYLVAGARVLFGRNVLALRFVTASVGLLTVAAAARWARRCFNARVAVLTAAGLSVMLWPVFWSRVGLRGMLLPLTMSFGATALWSALTGAQPYRNAALGGLWFGLAAYTYLAARGIPFFLVGAFLLLVLFDPRRLRRRWRALLVLSALALVLSLPLIVTLARNTDAQVRVYEVDAPLRALRSGDPVPVLQNVPRILGMATVRGDATERNNLPGRPVFAEPVWALAFYAGIGVVLGRVRDVRYGQLLVWIAAMVAPSLVTTEAPNFVRTLGALPAVMALPALGVDYALCRLAKSGRAWSTIGTGVVAVAVLANAALTAHAYFVQWVQIPEVGFVWQGGLRDVAAWLELHPETTDVTVGGLSTTTMDATSLDLLMRRGDVAVRWCDPGSPLGTGGGVVLPEGGAPFLLPQFVPFNPELAAFANTAAEAPGRVGAQPAAFQVVQWGEPPGGVVAGYAGREGILFQGDVRFLTLAGLQAGEPLRARPGESLTLFTFWASVGETHPDLKAFVHVLDGDGVLRAQHDGMDCPAAFWRSGDRIVQRHVVALPAGLAPGRYTLSVGLYDRQTMAPYARLDGQPTYEAGILEILDP